MKPRNWLFGIPMLAALVTQVLADESAKKSESEKTNPPAGRVTLVAPDLTGVVNAGEFLAAFAYTNQLGIEVAAVQPPLRAQLDLKEGQGVVVTSAAGEGDIAKDGLKPHDIVLSIDGQAIASSEKFHELAGSRQGKEAVLQVLRKAKPIELKVTFPNTPVYQFANFNDFLTYNPSWIDNQYRIGVTLAAADDVLRSQLRLADGEGLVITDVVADGPATKAGLRKHDVLVKLDGKRLTTVDACNAQLQEIKDRKVTATVYRGGKEISLELSPQLSAAAQWTVPYVSTIRVNDGATAEQQWFGRVNVNTAGFDSIHVRPLEVHWYDDLSKFTKGTSEISPPATAPPTEQIAQLKRQLKEMQKSLAALEAALQPAKSEQQQSQAPEQKPGEQTDKPQP
jgi:serine protease Do